MVGFANAVWEVMAWKSLGSSSGVLLNKTNKQNIPTWKHWVDFTSFTSAVRLSCWSHDGGVFQLPKNTAVGQHVDRIRLNFHMLWPIAWLTLMLLLHTCNIKNTCLIILIWLECNSCTCSHLSFDLEHSKRQRWSNVEVWDSAMTHRQWTTVRPSPHSLCHLCTWASRLRKAFLESGTSR